MSAAASAMRGPGSKSTSRSTINAAGILSHGGETPEKLGKSVQCLGLFLFHFLQPSPLFNNIGAKQLSVPPYNQRLF